MDIFTQKRVALWTIILLIVLNLSTLAIIWTGHKRQSGPPPQKNIPPSKRTLELLQQELGFSDEQIQKYDQLRREHAQQTQHLIHDLRRLKMQMMNEILTDHPDSITVAETAALIGNKQAEIEKLTFEHFLDLKKLCGENQVKKLQVLVDAFFQKNPPPEQEMQARQFRPGKPMRPPPGLPENPN